MEAAAGVNRERRVPVILVSAHHEPELRARAVQDHVMAYLVKPVKQGDVEAAIDVAMARFEEFETLRREAGELRQALEDRQLIERAKGIVMHRLGLDEAEAFRRLRKLANDQNRKLVDAAQVVISAETVFERLEGPRASEVPAPRRDGHRRP